jgi:hypothetical protein
LKTNIYKGDGYLIKIPLIAFDNIESFVDSFIILQFTQLRYPDFQDSQGLIYGTGSEKDKTHRIIPEVGSTAKFAAQLERDRMGYYLLHMIREDVRKSAAETFIESPLPTLFKATKGKGKG